MTHPNVAPDPANLAPVVDPTNDPNSQPASPDPNWNADTQQLAPVPAALDISANTEPTEAELRRLRKQAGAIQEKHIGRETDESKLTGMQDTLREYIDAESRDPLVGNWGERLLAADSLRVLARDADIADPAAGDVETRAKQALDVLVAEGYPGLFTDDDFLKLLMGSAAHPDTHDAYQAELEDILRDLEAMNTGSNDLLDGLAVDRIVERADALQTAQRNDYLIAKRLAEIQAGIAPEQRQSLARLSALGGAAVRATTSVPGKLRALLPQRQSSDTLLQRVKQQAAQTQQRLQLGQRATQAKHTAQGAAGSIASRAKGAAPALTSARDKTVEHTKGILAKAGQALRTGYDLPARTAAYTAAFVQSRVASTVARRAEIRAENPGLMHGVNWIGAGAVALVGVRIAKGIYDIKYGGGAGHHDSTALQYLHDMGGTHSSTSGDNGHSIELVSNTSALPDAAPVDASDVAPNPVALPEWGGNKNPSEGTVWGETMKYLSDMGVDTSKMTSHEQYEIVDDILQKNNIGGEHATEAQRWAAAAKLHTGTRLQMLSANGMEELFDKHHIAHGEFKPTVDVANGSTRQGSGGSTATPNGGHSNPQATDPTPSSPSPKASPDAMPSPSASGHGQPSPSGSSPSASTTPEQQTASHPDRGASSNAEIVWAMARDSAEIAAATGALIVGTGATVGVKERHKAKKQTTQRQTPAHRRPNSSNRP